MKTRILPFSILLLSVVGMFFSCGKSEPQVIIVKDTVRVSSSESESGQAASKSATSSQLANRPVEAPAQSNSEWWAGSIGGKYGIRMYINESTGEFWYHYTKYSANNRMYLRAVQSGGGHLVLVETNNEGMDTGEFDGRISGNTFSGRFSNYLSGKTYNFSLTRQ